MQIIRGEKFNNDRKSILLVGAGERIRREYVVRSVASGYNIFLIDDQDITWQSQYIAAGCTVGDFSVDTLSRATAVLLEQDGVDGILTYADYALEETAELAQMLGLRYTDVDSVRASRDKQLQRKLFTDAGVPSPQSRPADSLQEARRVAVEIGYPVVFKPRNLGGSAGVLKVASEAEASAAYDEASQAGGFGYERVDGILVEEMLIGPEISVETATTRGQTEIVAVTRKQTGFAPLFIETGHMVSADDSLTEDSGEVAEVTRAAIASLNLTEGVCHVELILTESGPKVVEVNARLGGDLIPYLVALACERDLCLIAAQIAVGDPLLPPSGVGTSAAISFLHPPRSGTLKTFNAQPPADSDTWLHRMDQLTPVGAQVTLPPDGYPSRIGFAVVTGDDFTQCTKRLDICAASSAIELAQN